MRANRQTSALGYALLLATLCFSPPAVAALASACSNLRHYFKGDTDIFPTTRYGLALMGGGPDLDAAFRWLNQQAGGGDLVVLRSSGTDGYQDYLYHELGDFNSVTTLVVAWNL